MLHVRVFPQFLGQRDDSSVDVDAMSEQLFNRPTAEAKALDDAEVLVENDDDNGVVVGTAVLA